MSHVDLTKIGPHCIPTVSLSTQPPAGQWPVANTALIAVVFHFVLLRCASVLAIVPDISAIVTIRNQSGSQYAR